LPYLIQQPVNLAEICENSGSFFPCVQHYIFYLNIGLESTHSYEDKKPTLEAETRPKKTIITKLQIQ